MENKIESKAVCRNLKGSARKARLVLDMIRGKNVADAKNILQFSTKRMAVHIHRLLNSAIANANQVSGKINNADMIVNKAFADNGPFGRRWRPGFKGGSDPYVLKSCHITIELSGKK